ncbi:MAG: isoprenoid biosynthesis glyoxalase ElbB [Elusimicrobiota bacterium]
MAKIGVVLSGCGVKDGAEIHESVLTLLALDRHGAEAVCMAPNIPQADVIDHAAGKPVAETRNVLVESARIARGVIKDIRDVKAEDLDAVILPGGFGAAKNLSTFARDGADCTVQEDVARLLKEMRQAGKPIGALCIAPAVLAKALGDEHPVLTIGSDPGTAQALESMGARHAVCAAGDVVVDNERLIVTTPAYMLAGRISEVAEGADKLVRALLKLLG